MGDVDGDGAGDLLSLSQLFPGLSNEDGELQLPPSGDAEAWHSFAALSRRIEVPGAQRAATLAATRAVLAPVEAAAWAACAATSARWSPRLTPAKTATRPRAWPK